MDKEYMPYKQKTIDFLENIMKLCDVEATTMIKENMVDDEEKALDALVWSSIIMSVHTFTASILKKAKK